MSSVGVFRKGEMDEKPYLVYALTQIDNQSSSSSEAPSMDSAGDNFPLPPSFFCPRSRARFQRLRQLDSGGHDFPLPPYVFSPRPRAKFQRPIGSDRVDFPLPPSFYDPRPRARIPQFHFDDITFNQYDLRVGHNEHLPFISNPHFGSKGRGGESLLDCDDRYFCKLPVVPIFWCNNKEPDSEEFKCGVCNMKSPSQSYYRCLQCKKMFHKECVESPLIIKHPYHPFHPLQLCLNVYGIEACNYCGENLLDMGYNCTTSELVLHPVCATMPVPFVVDHPKSHPHPLTLFPTQDSLVCHVCSLIRKLDPTYICIQCVFVIHKDCIGFPHVIRISRHRHRISFTSSLPMEKLSCGICRQQVDNKYSAYSCNKCDAYFVHSKCALHPKVWDGIELEGVSEEDDMIDDGEPFERISDGIILHPFHSHNLQLETSIAYDEKKYCQGCALPIYEGQIYSCMECHFILHESCANAPRMIRHPLNPQPLKLGNMGPGNWLNNCSACRRIIAGFHYVYYLTKSSGCITLDLRCASITEPFKYEGHKHPLFLPWGSDEKTQCQMCKEEIEDFRLICLECDYSICFCCVTLPYKVRYKHDSHFLKICDGKEACDQPDWCEICEGKIQQVKQRESWDDRKKEMRFYKCNDCCTTLHVECLLGVDIYMKSYTIGFEDVQRFLNSSLSRPICYTCNRRCPFPIYFKVTFRAFCTWYCFQHARW